MALILSTLILVFITRHLINMVLLLAHVEDFGKIKVALIALTHTDGFKDILGIVKKKIV